MVERRSPRVLIAGAGLSGRWHAYYARREGGRVVGVFDPDPSTYSERRFGRVPFFSSLSEALNQTEPGVVHVCAPTAAHFELSRDLLARGVHVLCEKPVAGSAAEVEELLTFATGNGVTLSPVHQFVFQRGVRRAKEILSHVGEIIRVTITFHTAGGKRDRAEELDALIGEILPHPLSLLDHFSLLRTDDWRVDRPRPGEIDATAQVEGVRVMVSISAHARPTRAVMELEGTGGTLFLDLFHGYSVLVPGEVSRARKILAPFTDSARRFAGAAANLTVRAVRRQGAYPGLRELIGKVYGAIEHGRALPISYDSLIAVSKARDEILGAKDR